MWTDVEIFNAKCGDTCLIDIDIILNPHNRRTNSVYAQIPSLIPNQWVGNQNKDNSEITLNGDGNFTNEIFKSQQFIYHNE